MADEEIGARLKLKDRKQFTDDAEKAGKGVKGIGDEADKADRKLRTMGGSGGGISLLKRGLGGLTSVVKTSVLGLAGLATAAAVGIGGFVNLASDAAETASAFTTVFGPATAEVQSFVDTVNQAYGIPVAELQDGARQFGVFAKAAGVPQDELAAFSTSLTQAALDLGSFYNVDTGEALLALQSGLSGEAEPLRKFGIFLSDAGLNAFAAAQGIEKTTQEMTDQEKVALRQQYILANLGDANGDLARTSGGLANQMRGFQGRLKSVGTAIGTALLPWVNKLFVWLNDKLGPIINELTRTAPFFADAFQAAFSGEGITTEAGSLVGIAERLGVAARYLVDIWTRLSGAWDAEGVAGVTKEFDKMLGTGDLVTSTVEAIWSIFQSLWKILDDLILPVWKEFQKAIPRGIRPLNLVAKVLEVVSDQASWLQPILAGLLAGFIAYKVVTGIINGIAMAKKAWAAAQVLLNTAMAMNPIGLVVIAIAALAAGLIYAWRNSETFREVVTAVFEAVKNAVLTAKDSVVGAFNTVKDTAMGVWNWINENWPLLLAILTGPIGLAVLAIVENWDTITAKVTEVKDWITTKWDELVDFITGLPERITSAASGMFDGIKDAFKSAVNWIIDAWNGLEFSIPGFDPPGPGPKFGGFTLGVPDIPRLHTGGTTVTGGTVNIRPDEELIVLPPAASVVPMTDTVASMATAYTGGGDDRKPIVLQVVLDRKVIAEAVYDHAGDKLARR